MPSSPAGIFRHSIDKACQYFQPGLTRKSLAFISLAYQGLRQDDLAALLGSDWDLLEFDALRFWLNTFLVKTADDTFVLSHSIFADVVKDLGTDFMAECQKQYEDFLLSNISDETVQSQLLYVATKSGSIDLIRLLATNDYVTFYGDNINPFIELLSENSDQLLEILNQYLQSYDRESGDWIDALFEQIPACFPDNIARTHIQRVVQTELKAVGDSPVKGRVVHFFHCYYHLEEYFRKYDEDNLERWQSTARLVDVFEQCIGMWPEEMSDYQFQYPFFGTLTRYIWQLNRQCRDDSEIHSSFIALINRSIEITRWYLEHCNPNQLPNDRLIEWMYEGVLSSNFIELSLNQLTDMAVRIHGLQLLLKPYPAYSCSAYEEASEELIKAYSKHFTEIEFIPTRLCELYPQFVRCRKEPSPSSQSFTKSLDHQESQGGIPYADSFDKDNEEEEFTLTFEDYLDLFDEEDDENEEEEDYCLTLEMASQNILKILGNLSWPYAISEDEIESLISLLDHLNDISDSGIRNNLLINISERIKQVIYHQADDLGQLFGKLIKTLDEYLESEVAQKMVYDLWDMAVRWQLERAFDEINRQYEGLGYIDPVYLRSAKDYFKSVGASGYLEKVKVDWQLLCNRCFIDYLGDDVPFGDNELTVAGEYHELGYVDRSGHWVIPQRYHMARPFSEGLAAVGKGDALCDGKWGFINSQGEEVIPLKYEKVGDFHNGVAWACIYGWRSQKKQAQFILIDRQGHQIGTDVYSDITSVRDGIVIAWKDGLLVEISVR